MIANKKFTDPSYDGWILPEICEDVDGTPLQRHYDESVSPKKLLSEKPWIVPDVLTDGNGNQRTGRIISGCGYIIIYGILPGDFCPPWRRMRLSVGILHKKPHRFCSKMSKGTCKLRKSCV